MQITVTYESLDEFLKYHRPEEIPMTPADKPAKAEPVKAEAKAEPKESVSKTDLRAVALKLSKAGKSKELREVFAKFGAEKLSDVKEEDYPQIMEELGKIDA